MGAPDWYTSVSKKLELDRFIEAGSEACRNERLSDPVEGHKFSTSYEGKTLQFDKVALFRVREQDVAIVWIVYEGNKFSENGYAVCLGDKITQEGFEKKLKIDPPKPETKKPETKTAETKTAETKPTETKETTTMSETKNESTVISRVSEAFMSSAPEAMKLAAAKGAIDLTLPNMIDMMIKNAPDESTARFIGEMAKTELGLGLLGVTIAGAVAAMEPMIPEAGRAASKDMAHYLMLRSQQRAMEQGVALLVGPVTTMVGTYAKNLGNAAVAAAMGVGTTEQVRVDVSEQKPTTTGRGQEHEIERSEPAKANGFNAAGRTH